jgi:uncharacterized protein YgiM (DUF1202 family)
MNSLNSILLAFLLFSFSSANCQAQDEEETQRDTLQLFHLNETTYILFDSINIRETPSLQGAIVAKLPLGTQVIVRGKSSNCLYLNGVTIPWYKIQFGKNQEGWIWGGKLALAAEKSAKNISVQFLFGIEKAGSNELFYTIKAIKGNKEISKATFKGYSRITKQHTFEIISNKGLENVDDIINIHAYGEFCGDDSGQFVFFWSNSKIQLAANLFSGFDAPSFYSESFVYPSETEGEKGFILKHIYSGEYSDDYVDDWNQSAVLLSEDSYTKYKWNGTQLIEVK